MLVLTRYINESIVIGDEVIVTVVRIKDGQVRLGITAPRETPVHRSEIQDRINNNTRWIDGPGEPDTEDSPDVSTND